MSLATLKKKTAAKYNNSSVGQRNFSLNGTHRSQGFIGQDLRHESCMLCTNDPNVIKPSVVGSSNYIITKHARSAANVVKSDTNHNANSQSTYIDQDVKTTLALVECPSSIVSSCDKSINIIGAGDRRIFNTKSTSCYNIQKDMSGDSKSSSTYISKLVSNCSQKLQIENNTIKLPLPGT